MWMDGFPQCSFLLTARGLAEPSSWASKDRGVKAAMRRHGPAHLSQLLKLHSVAAQKAVLRGGRDCKQTQLWSGDVGIWRGSRELWGVEEPAWGPLLAH